MGQWSSGTSLKPILYIFAISHFCEKARWALDYLQIEHDVVHLAPALHSKLAKKLGLKSSSLPILKLGEEVIQGSEKVIDWAEEQSDNSLKAVGDNRRAQEIEDRLGDGIGVHTRRMFYSEALIEHSATVRPIFMKDLPVIPKAFTWLMWPVIRRKMISRMDLGKEQGEQSVKIIDQELTWLESMLFESDGYLLGNTFSRVDLSAAALLARLASPPDHPSFKFMVRPPRVQKLTEDWYDRPALTWVRAVYSQHR
jgi:glutathione S-transferase